MRKNQTGERVASVAAVRIYAGTVAFAKRSIIENVSVNSGTYAVCREDRALKETEWDMENHVPLGTVLQVRRIPAAHFPNKSLRVPVR